MQAEGGRNEDRAIPLPDDELRGRSDLTQVPVTGAQRRILLDGGQELLNDIELASDTVIFFLAAPKD